jgi:hypothetical protein
MNYIMLQNLRRSTFHTLLEQTPCPVAYNANELQAVDSFEEPKGFLLPYIVQQGASVEVTHSGKVSWKIEQLELSGLYSRRLGSTDIGAASMDLPVDLQKNHFVRKSTLKLYLALQAFMTGRDAKNIFVVKGSTGIGRSRYFCGIKPLKSFSLKF